MYTSLPEDILLEIAQHATPTADDDFPVHPHWYNAHVPRPPDAASVASLRATCRDLRAVIPAPAIYLDIPAKRAPAVLERWADDAPDEIVQRIKVLRLRPDEDVPQHSVPVPDAQETFGFFSRLLHRTTALESLVIEHNPFCAYHKHLGLGVTRAGRVPMALPTLPPLLNAPLMHLHSLCVAIKCPYCTAYLTGVLCHAASASLRVLKSSYRHWQGDNWFPLQTSRPRTQTLTLPPGMNRNRHHTTVAVLARPQPRLTRLVAKLEWGAPSHLIVDIHQLARVYPGLVELSAVHFDASRKVAVVRSCQGPPGTMRTLLTVFAQLGSLRSLDIGLSPRAVVPEAFGPLPLFHANPHGYNPTGDIGSYEMDANSWDWDVDAAERAREGSTWRNAALKATEVLREAAPQVVRGAWWAQVGVPDYNQLIGYERVEWELDGDGEVVLGRPKWLAPMLVRNQDGMGSEEPDPSEYWG